MKIMKHIFFLLIITLSVGTLGAQSKYEAGMSKGLEQLKAAKTTEDMQAVSALFTRIGDAEKDKWLPYYYAAYANYIVGWMDEKADKDKIGGQSILLIEKAEIIEPNNAELFCLRQMVAVQQMTVDPMTRWQTYGAEASKAIENAKKADPNNPRIYYLEGQTLKNTPEAFGGGNKVAKPKFEKAAQLFETYKAPSPLHPDWGKEDNAKSLAECQ